MKKKLARAFYKATGWSPAGAAVATLAFVGATVVFLSVMSTLLRWLGVG